MHSSTAGITEIFSSIQGEGPYIGYKQIFIRFSGCNLSCKYCDTDHKKLKNLTAEQLIEEINTFNPIKHHSISLTGGEPLLHTGFLKDFLLKLSGIKIYLETNGTLPAELEELIKQVDIISMDIKIESSTNKPMPFEEHSEFIRIARSFKKEIFAKVVCGENIKENEINQVKKLIKDDIPLILQPLNNNCEVNKLISIQQDFLKDIRDVRVIPQVHKYLGLR